MGNPLSKCCGRDTTTSQKSSASSTNKSVTTQVDESNETDTSAPEGSLAPAKNDRAAARISRQISSVVSTVFGPKTRSIKQGLKEFPFNFSAEEEKLLIDNEIPAEEIENLSIGVDAGGMGVIHVAKWRGQKVAIKEATPQVEIYSRMRGCEGVVQFYGVTFPKGINTICIVTKYAEKGSLTWHLKVEYETLTWSDKLRLATQIASGIARLHQEGVYHRDLHGGNILIDDQGNALLTDFGASINMEERVVRNIKEYALEEVRETEGGSKFISRKITGLEDQKADSKSNTVKSDEDQNDPLIGVMAYIAPERFRNPKYFDAKCDIYSLGVLLWELTTGHSAFSKVPQDVHLAIAIMNGKRELPVEGTPTEYRELYEKCWQSDPSQRPAMDEILATLAKVRASMTPMELAATSTRDLTRFKSLQVYEESLSIPRPTSDIQQYILSE
ncbi:MAG: kinase-like domain-containing protein [Benniella sp.]|nr:MAG: kinase-like domain-containing protein [Benniella sp.]